MSESLISIIIPVYKAEKYIERCLHSLINQTYRNLEIIIVDDASPDKSGEICEQYAKQYAHIKVFHNPTNQGVSVARNVGLEHATGNYIGFVDPDDDFSHHIFERFHDFLIQNECDLVICGRYDVYQKKPEETILYLEKSMVLEKTIAMQMLFDDAIGSYLWDKLFKAELWNGIRFVPGKQFAEDVFVMHHVFDKAEKIGFIAESLYYYHINDNTLSNRYSPLKWVNTYLIFKERLEFAKKKYPEMTDQLQAMTLNFARLSLDNYLIYRDKCDEPYINDIIEHLLKGKHHIRKLPMKWRQKMMIYFYYFLPELYAMSVKFIHWLYYSFYPNRFRKFT